MSNLGRLEQRSIDMLKGSMSNRGWLEQRSNRYVEGAYVLRSTFVIRGHGTVNTEHRSHEEGGLRVPIARSFSGHL